LIVSNASARSESGGLPVATHSMKSWISCR
jgi:hypothetical protein